MPSISSKVTLTSAASSSGIAIADIDLIKGAFYTVAVYDDLADTYGVPRGAIRYNIFYFIDFIFIITLNILQFMDIIISLFALGFYNNYIKKIEC